MKIRTLSTDVLALFGSDFEQILEQIVSLRVKTLTNLIASRHVKIETGSLPVGVRRSKTSLINLPNMQGSSENLGRDYEIEEAYWGLSKLCWRSDNLSCVGESKVTLKQCPNSAKGNETTFKVFNWKVKEDRILFS